MLCLGEALVDLICEQPIDDLAQAPTRSCPILAARWRTRPWSAARAGAHVALAGGAGADDWGRWLRDRLDDEGVDLSLFELDRGPSDARGAVAVNAAGEARYQIYGETIATIVARPRASAGAGGRGRPRRCSSAPTRWSAREERELTMRARELRARARPSGRSSIRTSGCTAGAPTPTRPRAPTPACPARCSCAATSRKPS